MAPQCSLLIADDEESVRYGLLNYITAKSTVFGKIYVAEDGRQALEMIISYRPDVALMDIEMPYKSGIEVIREAHEIGVCPKTIVLSGFDKFEYVRQTFRFGIVDYLLKPCRPIDILERLESLVDKDCDKVADNIVQNRFVALAIEYMQEHYMDNITLHVVGEQLGISGSYLSMLFNKEMSCGFSDFLNRIRIEKACLFLHDVRVKTYEVSIKVGYRDEKYFSKVFKSIMGMSPSAYRKNITSEGD